jgi:hypothetical protein
VLYRLADGMDPDVIARAEAAAGSVPGVIRAHARARWTGRALPEASSFTWATRAAPA